MLVLSDKKLLPCILSSADRLLNKKQHILCQCAAWAYLKRCDKEKFYIAFRSYSGTSQLLFDNYIPPEVRVLHLSQSLEVSMSTDHIKICWCLKRARKIKGRYIAHFSFLPWLTIKYGSYLVPGFLSTDKRAWGSGRVGSTCLSLTMTES